MAATVLIVDDHASFRGLARRVLTAGGFEVVGEAADGAQALRAVAALQPDVVLLDIQLPDMDGFGVAAALAGDHGSPDIVLVSSRAAADYGTRIADSNVLGFIAKADLSPEALQIMLETVGGR
jgi:DNA-binding NarL/FixJ family response regulator